MQIMANNERFAYRMFPCILFSLLRLPLSNSSNLVKDQFRNPAHECKITILHLIFWLK